MPWTVVEGAGNDACGGRAGRFEPRCPWCLLVTCSPLGPYASGLRPFLLYRGRVCCLDVLPLGLALPALQLHSAAAACAVRGLSREQRILIWAETYVFRFQDKLITNEFKNKLLNVGAVGVSS